MTDSTPGPWRYEDQEYGHDAVRGADGRLVCHVFGDDAQAQNDARMIAAAPELLKALRKFRDQFDAFDPSSKASRHAMRMTLIDCDAAIAKATGAA